VFSFDKLPSSVKHVIIAFASAFGYELINAVNSAGGVTGLHWWTVLTNAINAGAVSAAGIAVVFWLTPITHEYGVGGPHSHKDVPPSA
jgi:hypothetical protein